MINSFYNLYSTGYNLFSDINKKYMKIGRKKHDFYMFLNHALVIAVENVVMLTTWTYSNSP